MPPPGAPAARAPLAGRGGFALQPSPIQADGTVGGRAFYWREPVGPPVECRRASAGPRGPECLSRPIRAAVRRRTAGIKRRPPVPAQSPFLRQRPGTRRPVCFQGDPRRTRRDTKKRGNEGVGEQMRCSPEPPPCLRVPVSPCLPLSLSPLPLFVPPSCSSWT